MKVNQGCQRNAMIWKFSLKLVAEGREPTEYSVNDILRLVLQVLFFKEKKKKKKRILSGSGELLFDSGLIK